MPWAEIRAEQISGPGLKISFCNADGEGVIASILSIPEAKILIHKLGEAILRVEPQYLFHVGEIKPLVISEGDYGDQIKLLSGTCDECGEL